MAEGAKVYSWMMGANRDDKGSRVLIYFSGANVYYDILDKSAADGFPELEFCKFTAIQEVAATS